MIFAIGDKKACPCVNGIAVGVFEMYIFIGSQNSQDKRDEEDGKYSQACETHDLGVLISWYLRMEGQFYIS